MFLKHIQGDFLKAFSKQNTPNTMNLLEYKVALKADRLRFFSARSLREIGWSVVEPSSDGF
jgi:hypothetical protein